jgi:MoaA/NifB/PqqE/SkfB family radical SAM enzyme
VARLLLVQPPLLLHAAFIDYPYFASLGLWQAAAGLRQAGHDVQVLDAFCLPTSNLVKDGKDAAGLELVRLGVPVSTLLGRMPQEAPDAVVLGHSPWLRARPAAAELHRIAANLQERWPGVPLVLADCDVGGMHSIAWNEADLDELGIPWGQQFEADAVLPRLLEDLVAGRFPEQRIVQGGPTPGELDDLPLPAYDLIDMAAFQTFLGRVAKVRHKQEIFDLQPPLLAIKSSRGCVYRCNFCTSNPWQRAGLSGKPYRMHSAEYLERHAALLKERFGVTRLVVLDELANVNAEHFDTLLDVAEKHGLRLDFPNGMRADRITREQVRRMAQVMPVLSISAESATERVANDVIGKRFDLEASERVARWCQEDGLRLVVHWMIGQPTETRVEILHTLQTAWGLFEHFGAEPLLQFSTPILGTDLHAEVTRKKLWTTREDRDIGPLFQGKPVLKGVDWTAHELWSAKRVLETKVEMWRPRKVIMNTTYVCNNQCIFCATGNRSDWHGETEKQIEFLKDRRQQGFDLCDFDGGEPTTNPRLFELITAAKSLGYQAINLTSNGRMMALPKNAEKVVRSGITSLLVSLHGPNEAVHEENVQTKGAFRQTIQGIVNARPLCEKYGVDFGVNVTLTKINSPVLLEYGELLVRMGVKLCNVQFLTPFGKASAECQPDPAEVAPLVMQLIDKFGDRIRFQVVNLPPCYLPGYEEYALADIGKLQRHMVFVSMDDVNLFDYLQSRRRHEKPCETCFFSLACEGFYYWPDEWKDEGAARWGD